MQVFFLHICLCTTCLSGVKKTRRKGIGPPQNKVTDDANHIQVFLQEQQMFLTAEPSLHFPKSYIIKKQKTKTKNLRFQY